MLVGEDVAVGVVDHASAFRLRRLCGHAERAGGGRLDSDVDDSRRVPVVDLVDGHCRRVGLQSRHAGCRRSWRRARRAATAPYGEDERGTGDSNGKSGDDNGCAVGDARHVFERGTPGRRSHQENS
jgi:hypothetical protein